MNNLNSLNTWRLKVDDANAFDVVTDLTAEQIRTANLYTIGHEENYAKLSPEATIYQLQQLYPENVVMSVEEYKKEIKLANDAVENEFKLFTTSEREYTSQYYESEPEKRTYRWSFLKSLIQLLRRLATKLEELNDNSNR